MYFKYITIIFLMFFYSLEANATLSKEEIADFYKKVVDKDEVRAKKVADPFCIPCAHGSFTLASVRKYLDEDKPNLDENDVEKIILRMGPHHMTLHEFQSAMNQKFTDGELNTIYNVVEKRESTVEKTRFGSRATKNVTKDGVRNYFKKERHNYGLNEWEVEGIIGSLKEKHMTRKEFKSLMRSTDNN